MFRIPAMNGDAGAGGLRDSGPPFSEKETEFVILGSERVRNNPDIPEYRHKVRVALPAGNDMHVEMVFDPGTGGGPQIETYIVAGGAQFTVQNFLAEADSLHEVKKFIRRKGMERPGMLSGGSQEVPVDVRVAVHHDQGRRCTVQDQGLPVISAVPAVAEDASARLFPGNVFHTPRCPELFHNASFQDGCRAAGSVLPFYPARSMQRRVTAVIRV